MKNFLLLLVSVLSFQTFAAVNVLKLFDAKIGADLDQASRIETQMKTGYRVGCPDLKTSDMSSCFKAQLGLITVRSAAQLAVLIKAGVNASLFDHTKGYDVEMVKVLLADNMLMAFEKVDVSQFYVTEFLSEVDKSNLELKGLRQNEEFALNRLFEESLPVMKLNSNKAPERKTAAVSKAKDPAAEWRARAVGHIESRLAKINPENFKFKNL